jgi:hypothetical protein
MRSLRLLRYKSIHQQKDSDEEGRGRLNEARFGIRYSRANVAAPHEERFYPDKDGLDRALDFTFPVNGYNVTLPVVSVR